MADVEGFKEARDVKADAASPDAGGIVPIKGADNLDWGLKNRLSRIINPKTGRTLMLAVDHGYFLGPTSGLEQIDKTIIPLLPYADSLMLTRGILRTSVPAYASIPIVLRVSGGSSILKELSNEAITVEIDEAIRLNVAAIALSIFVGGEFEKETLTSLAKLVDVGTKYGIPVLAVTAVGKDMGRDSRYLGLATRIAGEMGAHFVKTYFCDGFEKVTGNSPVPVVIAGGKKIGEIEALTMAYNAIQQGAVGVDMGRNIFQADAPKAMIKAVRSVVHEGATPEQAFDMYNSLKG